MTLSDFSPKPVVSPTTGRWLRSTVRRYPYGSCSVPGCKFTGALRRDRDYDPHDSRGWRMRLHKIPGGGGERCPGSGVTTTPSEVPDGWED